MSDDPRFAQAVELTIGTYDRVAGLYAQRNAAAPPFWVERMERFCDLLHAAEEAAPIAAFGPMDPDAALEEYLGTVPVLDAGCGPGRDARALAERGLPVLGVDLSQGMLDAARERTARRLPHGAIHYAVMDLRRLDLPDGCCRGVWCSASLLHLPKHVAPRAMSELARVARHGAPLAVFLKAATNRPEQEILNYPVDAPNATDESVPRFFAYYSPDEARALVGAAGFVVREVARDVDQRSDGAPPWICVLAVRP